MTSVLLGRTTSDYLALEARGPTVHSLERAVQVVEVVGIDGHAARGPLARSAARHFGQARARHGTTTTGPGPARPEAPGRAWAAIVARGTAQARPDGPMFNVPVKNIPFNSKKKENIGLLAHPSILIGLLRNIAC